MRPFLWTALLAGGCLVSGPGKTGTDVTGTTPLGLDVCQGDHCSCGGPGCDVTCGGVDSCEVQCNDADECDVACNAAPSCHVEGATTDQVSVDCDGSGDCNVDCTLTSGCTVDCADGPCTVACPSSGCEVDRCGSGCTVACGVQPGIPQNGTVTCP